MVVIKMNDVNNVIRKVTGKVCQTGGKQLENRFVNEDIIKTGDGYSFLMDGATGLGGPESISGLTVAEWYVRLAANFLSEELKDKQKDIRKIVTDTIQYLTGKIREYEREHRMTFKSYEEPSSSLLIYREIKKDGQDYIQIYALRRFWSYYKI